jgi:S-adenosylmethionine-dependent methyltransferase
MTKKMAITSIDEFSNSLNELVVGKHISVQDGFAALPNHEAGIAAKADKQRKAELLIKSKLKFLRRLGWLPIIKFIGISGSLAAGNPVLDNDNKIDIDVFVITRNQFMWFFFIPLVIIRRLKGNQANQGLCFNTVMDEWKEWQFTPWGRLFYSISHNNVNHHLRNHSLRILDVGGGNGMDSIYFASQGHTVVLLDYSSAMLTDARKRAEEQGVVDKITYIESDAQQIKKVLPGQQFDLILCNLMVEFVSDPFVLLRDITQLLTAGGLLSFIDGNRYCETFRTALSHNDLKAALQAVGTTQYPHSWFDRLVPIYSAEEMIQHLKENGCTLAGQYGIWCVTPYLPNDQKYEPEYYAKLEQLEFCLSGTYPYYLLARFFQIIMRKLE